jgi:putative acetyltransferase
MFPLRPLLGSDRNQLIDIYRDAVLSQAEGLYTAAQIEAWAHHAARTDELTAALERGIGLASCAPEDPQRIEAFALLEPLDRLSLLYCRGRSCRQGRATALLAALERVALERGCSRLRTEASQLSRPLLERLGWSVEAEEVAELSGERFLRWRMIKALA